MSIYISGSLAYDRIMTFPGLFEEHILPDKLHIINVSFLIDRMEERCGGTGGNVAYTLALLGEKPILLASVGKDFDRYEKRLKKLGLPLDGIRYVDEELTALAFITTDLADNQITGFCPSAMKFPCKYLFNNIDPKRDIAIISPGNVQDMQHYPEFFQRQGLRYIYDPSQQIPVFSGEQLVNGINGSYMLISNDYELELITNATGRSKEDLLELTDCIVTTIGEQGCFLATKDGEVHIPAVQTDEVHDPTGAGDALRGGMLWALHGGKNLEEALQFGVVAASFCVEKYGTQEHVYDQEAFFERYNKAFPVESAEQTI